MPIYHDDKGGSTFAGTMGAAMGLHKDKKEAEKKEHDAKNEHGSKHDEHLSKAKEHIDSAMHAEEAEEQDGGMGALASLGMK